MLTQAIAHADIDTRLAAGRAWHMVRAACSARSWPAHGRRVGTCLLAVCGPDDDGALVGVKAVQVAQQHTQHPPRRLMHLCRRQLARTDGVRHAVRAGTQGPSVCCQARAVPLNVARLRWQKRAMITRKPHRHECRNVLAVGACIPGMRCATSPVERDVASASSSSRKMMQPSGNCSHVFSMSAGRREQRDGWLQVKDTRVRRWTGVHEKP